MAYRCFCTPEALEAERAAALSAGLPPKYSGRCRAIPAAEAAARAAQDEPAAIRFLVTPGPDVTFHDLVRGDVTFSRDVIGDPIIVRSDGRPAYNFAVVVDDARMEITHVVRGEDHISNTPRQILIYDALSAAQPKFAHLSLVLGPDHAPLSKRHGATSVAEFRERGILPEALVNYLALLGWSPGENEELLPAAEMARRFDLSHVSHSAAVFDTGKLAWMNRHYMKEAAPRQDRARGFEVFRAGRVRDPGNGPVDRLPRVAPADGGGLGRSARGDAGAGRVSSSTWPADRARQLVRAEPDGPRAVAAFADAVADAGPLDRDKFRAAAARARELTGLKGRALFHPIRVALTAADSGPELDLAVPAIDRGAALSSAGGLVAIRSCAERAALAVSLGRPPRCERSEPRGGSVGRLAWPGKDTPSCERSEPRGGSEWGWAASRLGWGSRGPSVASRECGSDGPTSG